jgi:SSS family solute:Na+ symporter
MVFTIINSVVCLGYLIGVCYLVYKGRGRTHTPWYQQQPDAGLMALAHGAIPLGATAAIGFGGAGAFFGFSLLWLCFLCIIVGVLSAFVVCGKRARRMGMVLNAHTFPEWLGVRYQSRFIMGFAALVVFAVVPIYAAAILIGVARLIEVAFHIPYVVALLAFSAFLVMYLILGRGRGVRYIDTLHGVFMVFIMAIFCYWTYWLLGGIIPAHQALAEIASVVPERWDALGHQGWTEGFRVGSPFWWIACSSIMYGVGIGALVQPQLVTRFLVASSDRELNRGVLVAGMFSLALLGVPLVVGPLTNIIFIQRFDQIAIAVARGNMDKIIPLYVMTIMPWWFGTLFLVGVLAAATIALRLQFYSGAASFGQDFYGMTMNFRRQGQKFTTQVGMVLTIFATVLWGLVLPAGSIMFATALFFGVCASSFLPSYLLGLYWKGATRAGAMASMLGGIGMSLIWMLFFHYQESAALGLCEFLFGQVNVVAGAEPSSWIWLLQYVAPIVIALPVSFVLGIWVSRKTRKLPKDHVNRCFKYIA